MDPGTMAIVGAASALLGTGISMFSAVSSGMQQQKAGQAQADAQRQADEAQAEGARRNQAVAEGNAQATEQAAAYAEKQARLKAARLEGTQAVGYAKAGVLPEGSPLDVMAETAKIEEQDILATRYNYSVQAARYRSQADFYGFEGSRRDSMAGNVQNLSDSALTGGILKAGTSLLTTGASLAKSYNYNPLIPGSGWGSGL